MQHYIQWQPRKTRKLPDQIAESITHWQHRFELGSGILLCDDPKTALKLVEKQWRKLTMQVQKTRQQQLAAADILQTTRKISRMQRVRFSSKSPEFDPGAQFYVLSYSELTALPKNCFTLYVLSELLRTDIFEQLAPNGLVVTYHKPIKNLAGFGNKSILEESVQTEEANLVKWLKAKAIDLSILSESVEKTNEALDTLLSSPSLQAEFQLKTKLFFHAVQLAQPLQLSAEQQRQLTALEQLEHHVKILSTSWISDSLSSEAEDAFLLRDVVFGKLARLGIADTIQMQYQAGRSYLARALELQAGYVRI